MADALERQFLDSALWKAVMAVAARANLPARVELVPEARSLSSAYEPGGQWETSPSSRRLEREGATLSVDDTHSDAAYGLVTDGGTTFLRLTWKIELEADGTVWACPPASNQMGCYDTRFDESWRANPSTPRDERRTQEELFQLFLSEPLPEGRRQIGRLAEVPLPYLTDEERAAVERRFGIKALPSRYGQPADVRAWRKETFGI